jgi:hypothetical protein
MLDNVFTTENLNNGLELYMSGKCGILEESEDRATVTVDREDVRNGVYFVDFSFFEDGTFEASCDCAEGERGGRCRHMAAAIYMLKFAGVRNHSFVWYEEPDESEEVIPERENALFDESEEEYQYFSMPAITRELSITDDTADEARRLAEKKQVTIDEVQTGFLPWDSESGQICRVDGSYHGAKGLLYNLTFSVNREELLQMRCEAPGCRCNYDSRYYSYYNSQNPCKHIAALMLVMADYQKNHTIGDATDRMGMVMMDMFRSMHASEEAKKDSAKQLVANVDLVPRLVLENGQLRLSFRIGDGKLYVLKNIREFVRKYEDKDVLRLGKTSEIDLATAHFSEKGEFYLDFLSREVKQELDHKRNLEENSRSWYSQEVKAEGMAGFLYLYGTRLDDFFDAARDSYVAFTDKDAGKKEVQAKLTEEAISTKLVLTAEKERRQFQSIRVRGTLPALIDGSKHKYFVDQENNEICRLDAESMSRLGPIMKLARHNEVDIHIGRKNVPEFYYRILPRLAECAEIDNQIGDAVAEFLPHEVSFFFYLDADKNRMMCRPVAKYDGQDYSVLDFCKENTVIEGFRDRLRETEAGELAQSYFPMLVSTEDGELLVSDNDEDMAYRILDEGVSALMEIGEVHCTDRFKSRNIRRKVKISVGVSVKSEIMDLEVSADSLSPEELLDILSSYRLKKKYHKLKNGDFVDITDESVAELSSMVDTMHISPKEFVKGKMHLPLYRAIYLDKMLESCQEIYASRDHVFRNLVKTFKTVGDSDYELPDSLKKVLRNYQKYGYKWMRVLTENHFGGILADDMGLGKTAQVISVLLATKDENQKPSLIVCPASLVYNWQAEFEKFAPEMTATVIAGTQTERKELLKMAASSDVLITSYDLLKRDIADYEDMEFAYQVIDEAQYIKTHTTAAAKSVKVIQAAHKLALTGTPIENRLSELWSIFDYLMPGFLYSYDVFKKELETPIVKQKDEEATKRLKRMVSPFILRRLKKDVLKDLPDKMEELQYAHMEEAQQQLYDAQVMHMKDVLKTQDEESFKRNKIQILAELTRIRQICCDPSLMVSNYKGESAKRLACMDLIESAIEGEHKMLVFSQFTTMLELLAKDLDDRGIRYYTITGATPKEKRVEMVNAFNADDVPVFLISLKAGGTGLNLTGADVVIHYDPWWNVAAQNQATDRAHRIGQTKVVSVYKLIVKDSIEEKIVRMQQEKADLADAILNGENGNIVAMTRDDLLNLLSE